MKTALFAVQGFWRTIAAAFICCALALPAFAQKWEVGAPIPQGAEEVYGVTANGKLYVFGGLALAWKPIGMVMEYDPAKNAWTKSWSPPAKGSCWCRVLRVCRKWRP